MNTYINTKTGEIIERYGRLGALLYFQRDARINNYQLDNKDIKRLYKNGKIQ